MRHAALLTADLTLASSQAFAGTKTCQATGPVPEVKDDMIVVQKGTEKWK